LHIYSFKSYYHNLTTKNIIPLKVKHKKKQLKYRFLVLKQKSVHAELFLI